jgi:formylglycine-generating enzyme required for sulfatase activity
MREIPLTSMTHRSRIAVCFLSLLIALTSCTRTPDGMVAVPAGEFILGTDEQDLQDKAAEYGIMKAWFKDEHPAHRVRLPLYFVDKYEVTNSEYRSFVQDTGRKPPPDWTGGRYVAGKDSHPVVYVTWDDAEAYCSWAGKRLPSEAEWEKAARGANGLRYPWGNEFDDTRANINGAVGSTTEVGHYPAGRSPYGAYDMTGNVWEWTEDDYRPYPGNTDSPESYPTKVKVLRGNSWAGLGHFPPKIYQEVKAHYSRAGYRLYMSPAGRVNDVGFRCAKSAG